MEKSIRICTRSLFLIALLAIGTVTSAQEMVDVVVKRAGAEGGYLGVYLQDLTESLREGLGVQERRGAVIVDIIEDSPAQKAGLQEEDLVVRVNGERIEDADALREVIKSNDPGDEVELEVIRDGERIFMAVTLGESPEDAVSAFTWVTPEGEAHFELFGGKGAKLGVSIQDMSAALAEYFETAAGKGVLISDIEEGSPAQEAGLLFLRLRGDALRFRFTILDRPLAQSVDLGFDLGQPA